MKTGKAPKKFDDYLPKRVSFILTTKNRDRYLEKSLSAYRKLVKPQDELIVVDGGSTDNTLKVLSKYRDIVDFFISEPDISATHAFNKGILLARGKYIKNLNDDDEIYTLAMEQAIKVMDTHPEVDLLVCGGTKENRGKKVIVYLRKGINYGKSCEDVFKYGACGVGFVIRKGSVARLGLCPEYFASDAALALEFIKNAGIVRFCRINLYNHPIYKHSMIETKGRLARVEGYKLAKKYCSKSFYWRYRFESVLTNHVINLGKLYAKMSPLKNIFWPARSVYRQLLNAVSLSAPTKVLADSKDYRWDGGFS